MKVLDINPKNTTWRLAFSVGKKWAHEPLRFGLEWETYHIPKTRKKRIIYLTFGRHYIMLYYVRFLPTAKNGWLDKVGPVKRGNG